MVKIKRKVIQIANSTQLISLPRKWSQKYGVKKGDELEVEEQGNKILIGMEKPPELGSIEIDITNLDRDSFMFLIRVLYIKGYDEIRINFNNPIVDHHRLNKEVKVISEIHTEINRLSGIEIIQQRENFCILKVLSESSFKDFDLILRRIFLLVTDASSDLVKGASKGDKYLIESLEEKHNTITKFMANGLRLLNKFGHPSHKNTPSYYSIIKSLDEISDILKESARFIVDEDVHISKLCENMLLEINSALHDFYKLFYDFDFKLIEKLSSGRYKLIKNIEQLSKKLSKEELILVMKLEGIVEEIFHSKVERMSMQY